MTIIAHIKSTQETRFEIHSLQEHLIGTAKLSAHFAASFKNPTWGEVIGMWHDLGKYSNEFQDYIKRNSGYEEGEKLGKTDHTSAAAILANEIFPRQWPPIAYCIAGHHAGLHNWYPDPNVSGDLISRLKKFEFLDRIRDKIPSEILEFKNLEQPCSRNIRPEQSHLWIRMLFSCLVDADYLNTECFMNPNSFKLREQYDSLSVLKRRFDKHMEKLIINSDKTQINNIRRSILDDCIKAGQLGPGFFSLTVPTGGGKTLSSIAWALVHALKNNKSRIIFAIPYTSIISQTAQIYRSIFGDNNVVEHHSNFDDELNSQQRKLAAENWDAPIIVTTNVQLFESLYSNKTSRCRKLHNIANSIVILDEAQMLPPEFLKPILNVLRSLVELFGVSLMFSTATQPALTGTIGGNGRKSFVGIPQSDVFEVIKDVRKLTEDLKRVEFVLPDNYNESVEWQEIADELQQYEQVLCVVNTRNQCKELYDLMPEGSIHLSRLMCSAHITDSISEIKYRLKEKLPVRVISTQLIEAGVDIDFPIVYRAVAGLDSIAQCAGRCNREGRLNLQNKLGLVKVFVPKKGAPPGIMRKGVDTFKEMQAYRADTELLNPQTYLEYFRLFFSRIENFDKPDINSLLWQNAHEMKFQFATAANEFRLIDDKNAKNIIVGYKEGNDLIELLKRKGPENWLMRKLQRYSVSVYEHDFEELKREGLIVEIHGCWIQEYTKLYNSHSGLQLNGKWFEEINII